MANHNHLGGKLSSAVSYWSSVALIISTMVFIAGLTQVFTARRSQKSATSQPWAKTSLTERDLAIQEAIRQGKKEYSFETNFIPGMGRINNPEQHLEDWQKSEEQKQKTGS